MEKLRVIELFAGVGAWSKALENLGINHEVVDAVEFNEYAMKAYNVVHGSNFGTSDITKIVAEEIPECDMVCYSPPCQSFSVAGKGLGIEDARGTLFYDALRIITAKKPKYALMENVKNLTGKAHRSTFDNMLKCLENIGYTNHWKVLNSKEHGVPQNRQRVFIVSIRNDLDTLYSFPEPYDNGVRLRDILEPVVDEKYYIDDAKCAKLIAELQLKHGDSVNLKMKNSQIRRDGLNCTLTAYMYTEPPKVVVPVTSIDMKGIYPSSTRGGVYKTDGISHCLDHNCNIGVPTLTNGRYGVQINRGKAKIKADDVASCLDANYWKGLDNHAARTGVLESNELNVLGKLDCINNDMRSRVYGIDGISPTLNVCGGGNNEPKILVENNIDCLGLLDIKGNQQIRRVYSTEGISPTLNTMAGGNRQPKVLVDTKDSSLQFVGGIGDKDWAGDGKGFSRNYPQGNRVYSADGIATSQTAQGGGLGSYTGLYLVPQYRIRKLTPKECFRLQAFDDNDHDKLVAAKISNSQLYKIMGNSITVTVVEGIFKNLLGSPVSTDDKC